MSEIEIPVPDNAFTLTPLQQEFAQASEDEVLWGGAAGVGKSYGLRLIALGLNEPDGPAIHAPFYKGTVIRKSYPDLLDFRNLCLEMYPQIVPGVIWKETESTFYFPSGAQLILRHLREERDVEFFQGQELQFVGWDELTHQPSSFGYEYLKSRLRSRVTATGTLGKYVRATTNPGGPGHEWVKEHWRIPDDGSETCFPIVVTLPKRKTDVNERKVTRWRRFIPARLEDNPYVDPDYEAELAALDDDLKKRLLDGRWDVTDDRGKYYATQMARASAEGRILDLPVHPNLPVNTYFDLGRDMISVWFHQHVDGWDHFIDYWQAPQATVQDAARELQRRGYVYGLHFLPHDAEHKSIITGENTARTMFESLGVRPTVIVDKIPNIQTGIQLVRTALGGCRFDVTRCHEGLKALRNYHAGWDQMKMTYSEKPVHNWASHGADAFRGFAQGFRTSGAGKGGSIGSKQYRRRSSRTRNAARRPRSAHIV